MSELYKLPAGWEWKKLGDLAEYVNGMAFKPKDWSNDGFPIIRIQNLNGSDDFNYFSGEAKEKYYVKNGDILISWSASLDVYKWQGGNAILNQHIFNTIINYDVVDYDFFYHTIKYSLSEVMNNLHGVGMKHITKGKFENIQIPLPPLPEQKRIVAKLDSLFEKIDKAIELHQQNITNANTLMASTLDKTFKKLKTYEWCKLGDRKVCNLIMGQSPDSKSYNFNGIGMPFFQGKKEFGDLYPTVEQYTTEPKKIAEKGDILLSVRAPVGPTNIANIQCCIGRGLSAISPNKDNSLTNYLLYFFRNFELLISNKGKGSTFSAITKKDLEDIHVPLPPLPIQQQTVEYLDSIATKVDKIKQLNEQKLENLKALKASILDKAFRGEL